MAPEPHPPPKLNQLDFLSMVDLSSRKSSHSSVSAYQYLVENELLSKPPKDHNSTATCYCSPKSPCDKECLNYLLNVECHPKKRKPGIKCNNQPFRNPKKKAEIRPKQITAWIRTKMIFRRNSKYKFRPKMYSMSLHATTFFMVIKLPNKL